MLYDSQILLVNMATITSAVVNLLALFHSMCLGDSSLSEFKFPVSLQNVFEDRCASQVYFFVACCEKAKTKQNQKKEGEEIQLRQRKC